jgi:hypothetical protein
MSNGTSSGMAMWSVVVVMRCTTLKATADKRGRLLDYDAGFAEDRDRLGRLSRGPFRASRLRRCATSPRRDRR